MSILQAILVAFSLCADCFAVTLCSGVTLGRVRWQSVARVALVFALIQSGLLLAGWLLGEAIAPIVIKASHIIGFLLLLYVGGSMIWEGIGGGEEVRDLNGWKNVILGGIATSIDALAVGVAGAMDGTRWHEFVPLLVSVFAVTNLSVILGIRLGRAAGAKAGRLAEIAGGIVLIGIGAWMLF